MLTSRLEFLMPWSIRQLEVLLPSEQIAPELRRHRRNVSAAAPRREAPARRCAPPRDPSQDVRDLLENVSFRQARRGDQRD